VFHKYNGGQWSLGRDILRDMEVSSIDKPRAVPVSEKKEVPPSREEPRVVERVPNSRTPHRVDRLV